MCRWKKQTVIKEEVLVEYNWHADPKPQQIVENYQQNGFKKTSKAVENHCWRFRPFR
jgi:hypothetical protein